MHYCLDSRVKMSIKSRLEKVISLYFDIGSGPPSHLLRPAFSKVDSCTYQQKTILELFPFSWYWRGIDTIMIEGSVQSCWQRSNLPDSKGFNIWPFIIFSTNLIDIADGDRLTIWQFHFITISPKSDRVRKIRYFTRGQL